MLIRLVGPTVAIVALSQSCNIRSSNPPLQRNIERSGAEQTAPSAAPTLRIVGRSKDTVRFELRNSSNHSIFVSYVPTDTGSDTTFLGYTLEAKSTDNNGFLQYGEGFHHVPNLHPIPAQSIVTFSLVQMPVEPGEYRVRIGYYEDENVYKMISERLTSMNDSERKTADEARKYVFSEPFSIPVKSSE